MQPIATMKCNPSLKSNTAISRARYISLPIPKDTVHGVKPYPNALTTPRCKALIQMQGKKYFSANTKVQRLHQLTGGSHWRGGPVDWGTSWVGGPVEWGTSWPGRPINLMSNQISNQMSDWMLDRMKWLSGPRERTDYMFWETINLSQGWRALLEMQAHLKRSRMPEKSYDLGSAWLGLHSLHTLWPPALESAATVTGLLRQKTQKINTNTKYKYNWKYRTQNTNQNMTNTPSDHQHLNLLQS